MKYVCRFKTQGNTIQNKLGPYSDVVKEVEHEKREAKTKFFLNTNVLTQKL